MRMNCHHATTTGNSSRVYLSQRGAGLTTVWFVCGVMTAWLLPLAAAGKGSARCSTYLNTSASLWTNDPSDCKYGMLSTDDEPGSDCMSKPAGKCYLCTRAPSASEIKDHTCECISEARAKELHEDENSTMRIIGFILVSVSLPIMAYLVVRHEQVLDEKSCVGESSSIESTPARVCLFFLQFWLWPIAMLVGGIILLVMGYDVGETFYNGCCGNGYNSCIP